MLAVEGVNFSFVDVPNIEFLGASMAMHSNTTTRQVFHQPLSITNVFEVMFSLLNFKLWNPLATFAKPGWEKKEDMRYITPSITG